MTYLLDAYDEQWPADEWSMPERAACDICNGMYLVTALYDNVCFDCIDARIKREDEWDDSAENEPEVDPDELVNCAECDEVWPESELDQDGKCPDCLLNKGDEQCQ